jgi:hypothetical protein
VISFAEFESMPKSAPVANIESAIRVIRGQRVMLDFDLAQFYGVSTRQLNQALGRNLDRFPNDFAFQLTREELAILMSQIVTSSSGHGGRRKLPYAFTEHGVIMLASVLNSPIAVQASVRIVRTFVRLRELVVANLEIARRLDDVERRLDSHDGTLAQLFAAIRQLLEPPPEPPKPEIGFHVREDEGSSPLIRRRRKTIRYTNGR